MMSYDEDFPADLAIVGLGPSGLAAALRAFESGKKVIAFSDRSQYTRQQRIILRPPNYVYSLIERDKFNLKDKPQHDMTKNELEDKKFYTRLEKENTVQIKDIENYLYRKLLKTDVTIISTDKLNKISRVGTGFDCNYIELCGPPIKKYYCHHILAADGAKHSLANQINFDLNKDISYTTSPFKSRHNYHATVQLEIRKDTDLNPDTSFITQKSTPDYETDSILRTENLVKSQQWTNSEMPMLYVFANDSKTKFCFTGEIPMSIFDEPDATIRKNKLKEWASIFICSRYKIDKSALTFKDYTSSVPDVIKQAKREKKSLLQASVFKIEEFRFCDQPFIDLKSGVFASVGDARRIPYYFLGRGIQDGLSLAVKFVDSIRGSKFEKKSYANSVTEIDCIVDKQMHDHIGITTDLPSHSEPIVNKIKIKPTPVDNNALQHLIDEITEIIEHHHGKKMKEDMKETIETLDMLIDTLKDTQVDQSEPVECTLVIIDELLKVMNDLKKIDPVDYLDLSNICSEVAHDCLSGHALQSKTCAIVSLLENTLSNMTSHP